MILATFDGVDVLLLASALVLGLVWWRSCEEIADEDDK